LNKPRHARVCPADSVLAAFVEGMLDADARDEVAHHLADCSECVEVVGETSRFLAEEWDESDGKSEPAPQRRRFLAVAALVVGCVAIAVWSLTVIRDPFRRLHALADASELRTMEARLDGFHHRPLAAARTHLPREATLAQRAEVERLARSSRNDAHALHAHGVALLLSRDPRAAMRMLAASTRLDASNAAAWSDLAAAAITVGADDEALAAAERAIVLAPDRPAAHFNRALALEHRGRRSEAEQAYRRALALERDRHWRDEIAERLAQPVALRNFGPRPSQHDDWSRRTRADLEREEL